MCPSFIPKNFERVLYQTLVFSDILARKADVIIKILDAIQSEAGQGG